MSVTDAGTDHSAAHSGVTANETPPQPHCAACDLPVGRYRGAERRGRIYHDKRRCLRVADKEQVRVDTLRPDEALRLPSKGLLDELARMVAGEEELALLTILRDEAGNPGARGNAARNVWPVLSRMILIGHWLEEHPDEAPRWTAWANADPNVVPSAMREILEQMLRELHPQPLPTG